MRANGKAFLVSEFSELKHNYNVEYVQDEVGEFVPYHIGLQLNVTAQRYRWEEKYPNGSSIEVVENLYSSNLKRSLAGLDGISAVDRSRNSPWKCPVCSGYSISLLDVLDQSGSDAVRVPTKTLLYELTTMSNN